MSMGLRISIPLEMGDSTGLSLDMSAVPSLTVLPRLLLTLVSIFIVNKYISHYLYIVEFSILGS